LPNVHEDDTLPESAPASTELIGTNANNDSNPRMDLVAAEKEQAREEGRYRDFSNQAVSLKKLDAIDILDPILRH
jgi:hypothetical protein